MQAIVGELMKRYFSDISLIKRRYLEYLKTNNIIDDGLIAAGYFRKHKNKGCKKSRCFLCHGEKLLNIKSKKDKIFDNKYKDSLADYYENLENDDDWFYRQSFSFFACFFTPD